MVEPGFEVGARQDAMFVWFKSLDPVLQALLAGLVTCGFTAAGAATVFIGRDVNCKFLDAMLRFSGV